MASQRIRSGGGTEWAARRYGQTAVHEPTLSQAGWRRVDSDPNLVRHFKRVPSNPTLVLACEAPPGARSPRTVGGPPVGAAGGGLAQPLMHGGIQ